MWHKCLITKYYITGVIREVFGNTLPSKIIKQLSGINILNFRDEARAFETFGTIACVPVNVMHLYVHAFP